MVNAVINSTSKFFQKKFLHSAIFFILLLQVIFACFHYKYIITDTSKISMGITDFLQDMIHISSTIQEKVDKKGASPDEILISAVMSNPYLLDIRVSERNSDIRVVNSDKEYIILKTNILLKESNKKISKGLNLYIKKGAIKPYILRYLTEDRNYSIYSSPDNLLASFTFYDKGDVLLGNYSFSTNIENSITEWTATVQVPLSTFFTSYLHVNLVIIAVFACLYFYVFYSYKTFSRHHIESPLQRHLEQHLKSETERTATELKEIEEKKEALDTLKKMFYGKEENRSKPVFDKNRLKRIK